MPHFNETNRLEILIQFSRYVGQRENCTRTNPHEYCLRWYPGWLQCIFLLISNGNDDSNDQHFSFWGLGFDNRWTVRHFWPASDCQFWIVDAYLFPRNNHRSTQQYLQSDLKSSLRQHQVIVPLLLRGNYFKPFNTHGSISSQFSTRQRLISNRVQNDLFLRFKRENIRSLLYIILATKLWIERCDCCETDR